MGETSNITAPARAIRLLLVDDDDMVRRSLARFFRNNGWSVEIASSVDQALSHLASQSFDLLLTDVVMPEKTGVDLVSVVQQRYPALQVWVMTGTPDSKLGREARRLVQDRLMTKPFNLVRFLFDAEGVIRATAPPKSPGLSAA